MTRMFLVLRLTTAIVAAAVIATALVDTDLASARSFGAASIADLASR